MAGDGAPLHLFASKSNKGRYSETFVVSPEDEPNPIFHEIARAAFGKVPKQVWWSIQQMLPLLLAVEQWHTYDEDDDFCHEMLLTPELSQGLFVKRTGANTVLWIQYCSFCDTFGHTARKCTNRRVQEEEGMTGAI